MFPSLFSFFSGSQTSLASLPPLITASIQESTREKDLITELTCNERKRRKGFTPGTKMSTNEDSKTNQADKNVLNSFSRPIFAFSFATQRREKRRGER